MSWRAWLAQYSSAGTLAVGAALSQMILLLSTPFLTRLYGPEEYGSFGLFGMSVAVLVPLCGMCLSSALVLAEDDRERVALAQTAICGTIFFSGSLSVLLGVVAISTSLRTGIGTASWLVWWSLAVIATVLTVAGQFAYQGDVLRQDFRSAASRMLSNAIFSTSSRAVFGLIWPSGLMLAFGQLIGLAVAAGSLRRINPTQVGWQVDWSLIKKYREFPLHQSWQQIVNVLSRMMPIPLFAVAFGVAMAGHYSVAMLALGVAGQVIGKAVGDATLPEFARAHRLGSGLRILLRRSTLQLALLGLLPFSFFFLAGPQLFVLFFGDEWREAGEFARWMAPWLFVSFLNAPSLNVINILRLQAWASRLNLVTFVARVAALFSGVYLLQSAVWGVVMFAIAGLLHNALLIAVAFRAARRDSSRSVE
jgi:O-antigen/teichoic acid export membrane protein